MNDPVVIVGAARTPMGAFQGDFANVTASDLGAVAIRAAVELARARRPRAKPCARRACPIPRAP